MVAKKEYLVFVQKKDNSWCYWLTFPRLRRWGGADHCVKEMLSNPERYKIKRAVILTTKDIIKATKTDK